MEYLLKRWGGLLVRLAKSNRPESRTESAEASCGARSASCPSCETPLHPLLAESSNVGPAGS